MLVLIRTVFLGDVVFEEDNSFTIALIEDDKWYRALCGK